MRCSSCQSTQDIYRRISEMNNNLPECCEKTMYRQMCAPAVITDIQPYQAIACDKQTGKAPVIQGRAQHREFLHKNGYIEMGNEKITNKPRELIGDFNVKPQLIEATREVLAKQNH